MSDVLQDAEAILNKAWHYSEDAYAAFELLPKLVAEIKQAREQISRLGRLAFFGKDDPVEKIIDHFIQWGDSTFKYLQESKEQLAAKDKEIERLRSLIDLTAHNFLQLQPGITWEGGINDAMKAACEEIKRLRADIDFSDTNFVDDLLANCNQLRTRCWKAEGDCQRWQQTAIEERANRLAATHVLTGMVPIRSIPATVATVEDHVAGFRERAAKELDLEQEASYVDRLENAFLEAKKYEIWHRVVGKPNELLADTVECEARAALGKIREDACRK
ncbi:MAG: hypothetical protein M0Q16_06875 [Candidatus Cloacimonetes bacterium]|nr:hypothetical protein [Candidatus Cloacimonadota bacterium]